MRTRTTYCLAVTVVMLSLVAGISLAGAREALAQTDDPGSVLTAYLENYPSDRSLALVSDDAVYRIIPAPPGTPGLWTGKQQIRQLFQFGRGQHVSQQVISTPRVEGNKATVSVLVSTDDFRNWGVNPVKHTYEGVVVGGKLVSLTAIMDPSERVRVAAARAAMQAPAGMPRTGSGDLRAPFLAAWLIVGLLCAVGGILIRRARSC